MIELELGFNTAPELPQAEYTGSDGIVTEWVIAVGRRGKIGRGKPASSDTWKTIHDEIIAGRTVLVT